MKGPNMLMRDIRLVSLVPDGAAFISYLDAQTERAR
jgi:hypothetical protein